MTAILITQCLQRDFVGPVSQHEPLPNTLHVGHAEARRLLGDDPSFGSLAQLFYWARAQEAARLRVIHIRDWHNPNDPAQRQHLEHFGPHCLEGTPGAELIVGNDDRSAEAREHTIYSISLNDFAGGTNLASLITELTVDVDPQSLRIGVVGVWTEAKVTFLLYELATRCQVKHLATCSALTASASRLQHFNALEQLRKILGVHVYDSLGEFQQWLVPDGVSSPLSPIRRGMRPRLKLRNSPQLADYDLDALEYLYRDSSSVELRPLDGGFSQANVFRVFSHDAMGHLQAASVLKLGPRDMIARERVSFEQVELILGNNAPSIRDFVDVGTRAGIKFAYAGMGSSDVCTFKQLYESGLEQHRVNSLLDQVFRDILGRFQTGAQYERLPLLKYYNFDRPWAQGIREQIASLLGEEAAAGPMLSFPGGYEVCNVAGFYDCLDVDAADSSAEWHFVSYVHGDLNAANILVDERDNAWLVDFFHTHRGHALCDLAKFENDLLYILTRIDGPSELAEALQITRALRCVKDLRAPLAESPFEIEHPQLARCWQSLRQVRRFVASFCQEERDPMHLCIALLRYAVHTLSFAESNCWQKMWALAAAGGYADDLTSAWNENRAMRIDWLPNAVTRECRGRLGLTICPGRIDRGRHLGNDLAALAAGGARRLLTLLTSAEMEWAGVAALESRASEAGLCPKHDPIPDQGVPSFDQMDRISEWIEEGLAQGDNTVIHCLGGLGRSGTVAACLLVRQGRAPDEAIRLVRETRGPRAVENASQEKFVQSYASRQDAHVR